MIQTQKIKYNDGAVVLEAVCAWDTSITRKRPAVMVAHDWSGRNEFMCQKAEKLAALGYVGFALDMYGQGQVATTTEAKTALMSPFMEDRALLQQRITAAFQAVTQLETVDATRIAAIGFCFGGACALDLARSGAKVLGVASFHGLLNAPSLPKAKKIVAKVLAMTGHDDPMVPPEVVLAFQQEMTEAGVDWQMSIYGQTQHAFSNPAAHDETLGLVYNRLADQRSWIELTHFLNELFH